MLSNQLLPMLVGVFLRLQVRQTPQVLSGGWRMGSRPPCPLRPVALGTEQNLLFKSFGSYFWLLGMQGDSLAGSPRMGSGGCVDGDVVVSVPGLLQLQPSTAFHP